MEAFEMNINILERGRIRFPFLFPDIEKLLFRRGK
jgi:hypothetical protein